MNQRYRLTCMPVVVLLVASMGGTAIAQVASDLAGAISRIDSMSAAELAKDNIGGVTVGVVSGSRLVWSKSYGYADMEKKTLADQETIYRIGSITKQFTGV